MHQVKYGLFFDNHTHMEVPGVGRDFDPEYFTDRLLDCGVDYLTFHARCNVGMAYCDTRIGTRIRRSTTTSSGRSPSAAGKKASPSSPI